MATVTVSSSAGLISALKTAHAGDTIQLAAGNYASVAISNVQMAGTVTITSANLANPAVIDALTIKNSSGLRFSNITFETSIYNAPTTHSAPFPFQVANSSNISFNSIDMHGTYSNADDNVNGLYVLGSSNVSITNSKFYQLYTAITELNNNNVVIANNTIQDIRTDGIDNGGTSNIVISGNQFSNFFPVGDPATGDHPDAIQFWTANTTTDASNIVVENNTYVRGTGLAAQGVFITDTVGLTYNNVSVTGNTIIGGLGNGIDVSSANNVMLSNNNVIGYPDITSSIRTQGDTNISMLNNLASAYYSTGTTFISQLSNQAAGTINPLTALLSLSSPVTTVAEAVKVAAYHVSTGNALTGDHGSNIYLADVGVGAAAVKTLATTGATLTGSYGTLTIQPNGAYTYVETKDGLTVGQTYDDHFTLTVASTSGSVQTSTLDILVTSSGTGNGGIDNIIGGVGAETISGFGAKSNLISGTGPDTFVFNHASQSDAAAETNIRGFKAVDTIDLSAMDPTLHLVTALDGHAHEVVIRNDGNGAWDIYGDVAGTGTTSATADFLIHLAGSSVTSLTAANLHL